MGRLILDILCLCWCVHVPQSTAIGIYCTATKSPFITEALQKTQMSWMHTLCSVYVLVSYSLKNINIFMFYFRNCHLILINYMQLNHVFKTRDLVTKNDAKVSKLRETANNEIPADDSFLDHGFTRPKVYKCDVLVINILDLDSS